MYWAEEKQYSVLPRSRHIDGREVGDCCHVRAGRSVHEGLIVGFVKYMYIPSFIK